MNPTYQEFLQLSKRDRQDVFEAAAERLDTIPTYIEKDFWLCLCLDVLYNGLARDTVPLLLKGGTTLSKAFNIINRFSEDIDITVSRFALGFSEAKDPLSDDLSNKQRSALIDELKSTAASYVYGPLKNDIISVMTSISSLCKVVQESDNQDTPTLLVEYPSLYPQEDSAYVQPRVKLASGARSALSPSSPRDIIPYISEDLPNMDLSVCNITTIDAERTFWDKILIMHGRRCGYDDKNRLPEDRHRVSRHYYDVALIVPTEICENAVNNVALLNDVRKHSLAMFRRGWEKLEEARLGTFRLIPSGELLKVIERDYEQMKGMIFGSAPSIDEVMGAIGDLERKLNSET